MGCKMIRTEYNADTNITTEITLTKAEVDQLKNRVDESAELEKKMSAIKLENAIAKSALLDRLGITADEAKLLLS